MAPMDIAVDNHSNPTVMGIKLEYSNRSDRCRDHMFVGKTGGSICPITAMMEYLLYRGVSQGPLFILQDGSPLSRTTLVTWLKQTVSRAGMDASRFSGHSFRIGAATTAAAKGISAETIQTLGRWASDSYKRYIHCPANTFTVSSTLVSNSEHATQEN